MKQSTKKFEKQFIRSRNVIERKGIALAKYALKSQYNAFLEKARQIDFRQWPQIIDSAITEQPIKHFFELFYPMSSKLALMVRKNMLNEKADDDVIYESIFQRKLSQIVANEAGVKITSITNTTKESLKKIVRQILYEADTEGWGIDKITSQLFKEVGSNLVGNGYARVRAIAQTEMISASNQASEFAAKSTGYDYKKFWSTSGLPNIRDSHIEAEQYSINKNGLTENETFPNGLLYPGDPNGPPEEIINCRCTILHEII